MKTKLTLIGLAAAFVLANCVLCPEAYAGRSGPRVTGIKPGGGSLRVQAPGRGGFSSRRLGGAPSLGGSSRRITMPGRPGGGQRLGSSRPSGLSGRGMGNLSQNGYGGLAGALLNGVNGGAFGGRGGYGGGYGGNGRGPLADYLLNERYGHGHYEDPYADAYRDVGIANAVVGLVGVILNAAQAAPVAPQPVAMGHYETHKVIVREACFEQEQVWVPPLYDSRTGAKIGGGFHETRTRLVPEVCEYQKVWIPE